MRIRAHIPFVLPAVLLGACSAPKLDDQAFVSEVHWLVNIPVAQDGLAHLDLDYADAFANGFVVPSAAQAAAGFTFAFRVHDPQGLGRSFRYKLYYQNTSYKFPEATAQGEQHPQADENFYGSWQDASEGFRATQKVSDASGIVITDHFRIHGDPRDEPQFVVDGTRQRYGRNPRVGHYRFLLVVLPEELFAQGAVPKAVIDIRTMTDGQHVDPFWYFLFGPGSRTPGVEVHVSDDVLAVRARPDMARGIHSYSTQATGNAYCATCGDDPYHQHQAAWEQHYHRIDPSTRFENIPLIADPDTFTYTDYAYHRAFTPRSAMIAIRPSVSPTPCSTVGLDTATHTIVMHNPATRTGEWRKEDVGVHTRHPLTYGRYRVHCMLPRLLNDGDLWNGLTNAVWLMGRSDAWARRRSCDGGYLANYSGGDGDVRTEHANYAEIDFEILKSVPYCPQTVFPPNYAQPVADKNDRKKWLVPLPEDVAALRGMVTVACTNWDMACPQPEHFGIGCNALEYDGRTFWNFRWDRNYRALTQKTEEPDAEIFGTPYWFEIDWRPTEIFWRIGPDLDHMRLVNYMNASVTSIPEVPMELIISQEYHNTTWWPGSPYEQGFLPFPSKDHVGRVLEVIVD